MNAADTYPHVFEPMLLGNVELRNRIFVPAHTTNLAENFLPSERNARYLAERAKGGPGLLFTEAIRVHPTSIGRAGGLGGWDERSLPGFRRMAEAVKEQGAELFGQILHTGRHSDNIFLRTASWGPSPIPHATGALVPHAMTHDDIRTALDAFVFSTQMVKDAGMRGLEINLGHGHLLHQFLSPVANHRDDEYGGSEENRLRFPLEVIQAVIAAAGDDMVIGIRYSGEDFEPGGVDVPLAQRYLARIAAAAPIKFVNVTHSAFRAPSIGYHQADMNYGPAPFVHLPLAMKEVVPGLPVFAVCRFTDLSLAEDALATGKIAMVGMARAHIADPFLIRKTLEGREAEIIPCVACNRCHQNIEAHQPITCMMNPAAGKEIEWPQPMPKAAKSLRVLVAGGGPAGLEAARVAAERGHEVHLWEAEGELGGQVRAGRNGKGRSDLDKIRAYQTAQHERLGIRVKLDHPATVENVLELAPDAVIVATGGRPSTVSIDGWGTVNAASEHLTDDLAGKTVVLVDNEGGWTIASSAETMAGLGARVTVVTPLNTLLPGLGTMTKVLYVDRLGKAGVPIRMLRRPLAFAGGALEIADTMTGAKERIEGVDHIYVVAPPVSVNDLAEALHGKVPEVHLIGDAEAPRTLLEVIFAGHRVARGLGEPVG